MEDKDIVELYWQRADAAIAESARKYGRYCHRIAYNICGTDEGAEECVSDTWLQAWNRMPDQRPSRLAAFLGCITRNLAINRLRAAQRQKRGGGETALALEELGECLSPAPGPEQRVEERELEQAVGRFVAALPEAEKRIFVLRYWYLAPVAEIAERLRCSQGKIKSSLFRTRKKLGRYLQEEGLC